MSKARKVSKRKAPKFNLWEFLFRFLSVLKRTGWLAAVLERVLLVLQESGVRLRKSILPALIFLVLAGACGAYVAFGAERAVLSGDFERGERNIQENLFESGEEMDDAAFLDLNGDGGYIFNRGYLKFSKASANGAAASAKYLYSNRDYYRANDKKLNRRSHGFSLTYLNCLSDSMSLKLTLERRLQKFGANPSADNDAVKVGGEFKYSIGKKHTLILEYDDRCLELSADRSRTVYVRVAEACLKRKAGFFEVSLRYRVKMTDYISETATRKDSVRHSALLNFSWRIK